MLFSAFPQREHGDAELRVAIYGEVLSKLPIDIVSETIWRVISGRQPEHDGQFCPTAAQIAKWSEPEIERRRIMEWRRQRLEICKRDGYVLDNHSSSGKFTQIKSMIPNIVRHKAEEND